MTTSMPWIKLWTDTLDDPKFGTLTDALRWKFVELCLLAGECDAEGYLVNGNEPMDLAAIAWRLRRNPAELEADLELFIQRGFVIFEDGIWLVTNFAKRQGRSQSEKREMWRKRKQRQRERQAGEEPDPLPEPPPVPDEESELPEMPENGVTDDESHAGITRDSRPCPAPREEKRREEKRQSVAPSGASSGEKKPPGLTEGQQFWLSAFNAKRFSNTIQREAVLALERDHGTDALQAGVTWAAKQGMSMGRALTALETALPKWGKPKPPTGANAPPVVVKGL